jgi:hypothetical protein
MAWIFFGLAGRRQWPGTRFVDPFFDNLYRLFKHEGE